MKTIHLKSRQWAMMLAGVLGALAGSIALSTPCRAGQFSGGTGEPNSPYLISTPEQFLAADFNQVGVYFRLSGDIDLADRVVTERTLACHLDGDGHKIRDVHLSSSFDRNWTYPGLLQVGLFEITRDGAVARLALVDVDVTVAFDGRTFTWAELGTLASGNHGTITNCSVTGVVVVHAGSIYSRSGYSRISAGGLAGVNQGVIEDCYFDGWVSGDWKDDDVRMPNAVAGGLVGENGGRISCCYSTGVVVAETSTGGLVGHNSGSVDDSYSRCYAIAGCGAGGLVACNGGQLHRCHAEGWVTGEMRGGLVGMASVYCGDVIDCLWDVVLTNCTNSAGGMGDIWGYGPYNSIIFASNGWAGDPNWVMDPNNNEYERSPRLSWEGTGGQPIPPLSPLATPFEGSGTVDDPYLIRNEYGLGALAKSSIYWGKHFLLVNDVNLGSGFLEFSPIGVCRGSPFSGIFDGNGHAIRGWTVDTQGAPAWYLGVFGCVTGQVKNLGVEDVNFTTGRNSHWVGLLAGISEGTLTDCHVTGFISAGENSSYVGQVVGYSENRIADCQADAVVTVGDGSMYIGGLAGWQPGPGRGE